MATNNESNKPRIQSHDQYEKRSLQFIALCIILTAMLFVLIDAVVYFTDLTGAAPLAAETFETAKPAGKVILVLP